jgi:Trypsin-like peptidase domain
MFADACDSASQFTFPLIVSVRYFDGTVRCSLGSYIYINREGWILTVAHMFEPFSVRDKHSVELRKSGEERKRIETDDHVDAKHKRKKIDRLTVNKEWITNCSLWWGIDGTASSELKIFPELDLAIAKIAPFNADKISQFPIFKNAAKLRAGTSLCRLGFPFHDIKATFNDESKSFILDPGVLPIPRFPIEGIYTRNILAGKTKDNKYEIKFIETSSPGLRGQSGGPVFDIHGSVWGIQSRTHHFPLGFSPKVRKDGREVEENQFLSVGWAVHPDVITSVLKDCGIQFDVTQE